jgi:hypothetical protein
VRRSLVSLVCVVSVAVGVTGCGDPTAGFFEPQIVTGSFEIAVARPGTINVPSALSVVVQQATIEGARFPERSVHAGQWEILLSQEGGQLFFNSASSFGFQSRAAITLPLTGRTFGDVRDVPSGAVFQADAPVPVEQGSVYVVRSREFGIGGSVCLQYAKIQPTEVDPTAGTVRVQVATNGRCYDTRLAAADS